jgi:PAS domain S-box-containing protein
MSDGVVLLSSSFVVEYANPSFVSLVKKGSPENILNTDFFHLATDQKSRALLEDLKSFSPVEVFLSTGGTDSVPVELSFSPRVDSHGLVDGYIVVARDMSRRRDEQTRLQQEMEKYRDIASCGFDWLWEVDSSGTFTFVSPSVKDVMGYSSEELFGKTPFEAMTLEEGDRVASVFNRTAFLNENFNNLLSTCISKDGEEIVVATSGVPVFDKDGELRGYRGGDRDVTSEVRTAEMLKKSHETTRQILDSLPVGVVLVDGNKRIRQINRRASVITGRKQDELIGEICSTVLCSSLVERCPIIDLNRKIGRDEHFVVHRDGHTIPVVKSVTPIHLDSEEFLLEAFIDVSGVKTLRDDISEQNSVLLREIDTLRKNSAEAKQNQIKRRRVMGRFITDKIASLCGITGVVDILLEHEHALPVRDLLVSVQTDYRELISSVRLIQNTMTMERNPLPQEKIGFVLEKLVSLAVSPFHSRAAEKEIDMHVSVDPLLSECFLGPARGIENVLQVMLDLSMSRQSVKGIEVGVISLSKHGKTVDVMFSVGFPEDGFVPEENSSISSDRSQQSFSGRVSACREFVRENGGDFGWRDQTGSGTAFWLTVPMQPCENKTSGCKEIPPDTAVLVIESSRQLRSMYSRMLQSSGCAVKAVPDRASALLELRESQNRGNPFKAIVINGDPGQEQGMITAGLVRSSIAEGCRAPIIICSSSIGVNDVERFQKQGYAALLRKPLVLSTLRNCLSTILNRTGENTGIVTEYLLP